MAHTYGLEILIPHELQQNQTEATQTDCQHNFPMESWQSLIDFNMLSSNFRGNLEILQTKLANLCEISEVLQTNFINLFAMSDILQAKFTDLFEKSKSLSIKRDSQKDPQKMENDIKMLFDMNYKLAGDQNEVPNGPDLKQWNNQRNCALQQSDSQKNDGRGFLPYSFILRSPFEESPNPSLYAKSTVSIHSQKLSEESDCMANSENSRE